MQATVSDIECNTCRACAKTTVHLALTEHNRACVKTTVYVALTEREAGAEECPDAEPAVVEAAKHAMFPVVVVTHD